MKHLIPITLILAFVFAGPTLYAQNDSLEIVEEVIEEIEENEDDEEIEVTDERIIISGDEGEEVIIDNENRKIIIVDGEEHIIIDGKLGKIIFKEKHGDVMHELDSGISMHELHDSIIEERIIMMNHGDHEPFERKREIVTTDWFNFQIGLNNTLNVNDELEMPLGFENMEISTGKSINFHIHFVQQALNIYKENVRLVYGIGLDINNYRFSRDVNFGYDTLGALMPSINQDIEYKKNKLVTQYLTVPLMLNIQLGHGDDMFKLSFGPTFGYLINSHQKLKWSENGKQKSKIKDDFNLEKFRMGYEVQFGYGSFVLFGKYYPNSMFKQDLGPEIRTVSAGILLGSI
ncbi:MAG: outer membrane beta-barrel protein [Bacteroidia bacterium]